MRRRVQIEPNKGEARNALARAVFFYRLDEIRERSFEQQRYRASGLNLVTAAIVLCNTTHLERATSALREHGAKVNDGLFQYLSPLGCEHINLTGYYVWRGGVNLGEGRLRPLRPFPGATPISAELQRASSKIKLDYGIWRCFIGQAASFQVNATDSASTWNKHIAKSIGLHLDTYWPPKFSVIKNCNRKHILELGL